MNSGEQNAIQPGVGVQEAPSQAKSYGGIGRLGYFLGMLGVSILNAVLSIAARDEPSMGILALVVTLALSLVLIANRLRNIGMSGWWSLLTFIPIANLILGVRCLMMPEGYQDTKRLDTAAKVILGIVLAVAALVVVSLIIFFAA